MSLELDIHNLLIKQVDPSDIGAQLLQQIETDLSIFSQHDLNSFYLFLIKSGQSDLLIQFTLSHLDDDNFEIPWPYFLDALTNYKSAIDEKVLKALNDGLEETHGHNQAALSTKARELFTGSKSWREDLDYDIRNKQLNTKKSLLDDLNTFRTQQLFEQEHSLIKRLQKMYPGDRDILKEAAEYKKRSALEVLQKKGPRKKVEIENTLPPIDPELKAPLQALSTSLIATAEDSPDLALDLAVVAYIMDDFEVALEIINKGEAQPSLLWFKLEALLKARHFVELLDAITQMEMRFSHDSETFFATAYLRAQALWGLGQKHAAIEVMEGLLASRPHYRAGAALLSVWSHK